VIIPPSSSTTRYSTVAQDLRSAIERGDYRPGQKLPNERDLATHYQVSRTTVRVAISRLRDDSLVVSTPGKYGVFVAGKTRGGKMVHLVGLRSRSFGFEQLLAEAVGQSVRRVGWKVCVHGSCPTPAEARKVVREISADASAVGGVLLGAMTSAEAAGLIAGSRVPWVRLGDFTETTRLAPVMDQVIGDNYLRMTLATQALVAEGCRNLALVVFGRDSLWAREIASAYRSVLDAAGVPPENQQIIDLMALRPPDQVHASSQDNTRVNAQGMLRIITYWRQTNSWPQGIIFECHAPDLVTEDILGCDPAAREKLADLKIAFCGSEEELAFARERMLFTRPMKWFLAPLSEWGDVAMTHLQSQISHSQPPRREYVRTIRMENTEGQPLSLLDDEIIPHALTRLIMSGMRAHSHAPSVAAAGALPASV